MRALMLIAATLILPLAACKNNDQVDNNMNVDESLTAENIVSNDVTAIDAVTGDAANMAADVEINDVSADPLAENSGAAAPAKSGEKPQKRPTPSASPKPRPAADTSTAATTNSAD